MTTTSTCNREGSQCQGFVKLLEHKAIHHEAGELLDRKTGEFSNFGYYWLGPKRRPQDGMFVQYCPCCGGEVALTAKFLAEHAKEDQP